MLRGYGSERAARDGLSRGAFVYLTKPCYSDHLVHKIGPACRKEGGGASG